MLMSSFRINYEGGTHFSLFVLICILLDKIISTFGLNKEEEART